MCGCGPINCYILITHAWFDSTKQNEYFCYHTVRKEEASRFVYVKTKQTNKLSIITNPTHTPVIYPEWVGVCFDLISLLICQKVVVIIVLLSGLNIWYWNVSDCVGQIKSTF